MTRPVGPSIAEPQEGPSALDAQKGPSDDLFFDSLVRAYVAENLRFLRREWLAEELNAKIHEAGARFVLLTAQPGAGKSAFMAQLAADHLDWLRYFIRWDQRDVLADVSAKSFLLRIGYQLAALQPNLFSQEELSLSVEQQIGEMGERAEAVGVEVRRLTASPFYKKVIEIRQQVLANQGKMVGLRVQDFVVESRLLTTEDLFHLALVHPARALKRGGNPNEIVVLIDALDEIRYHQTDENILTWLTNSPALPDNVRFVLTSRPTDDAIRNFCEKQKSRLRRITLTEEDAHVKKDIAQFVDGLVGEPAIALALQDAAGDAAAFADKAAEKARGNLGYLDALARGIDQALKSKEVETLQALLSLKELPGDLEGLYAFFLHQIKVAVSRERIELKDPDTGETYDKPVWPAVFDRVLGVLAVATEPVDLDLIAQLGGIRADRTWVLRALERLLQFLELSGSRYRLYHATVAEFLTSDETRVNEATTDLHQDPKQRNRQIADHYWVRFSEDWSGCTADYALRNLARHLYAGGDNERLQRLISRGWMNARQAGGERALTGFADDVGLAWRSETEQELQSLETLTRLNTARLLIDERASSYTDPYLEALIWQDRADESISLAQGRSDPEERFQGLLKIYQSMTEMERASKLSPDPERRARTKAVLLEALEAAARTSEHPSSRARALSELGASLQKAGSADGSRLFAEAEGILDTLVDSGARVHGFRTLAVCLADAGDLRAGPIFRRAAEAANGDRTYLQILAKELSHPGLGGEIEAFSRMVKGLESASDPDYVLGWVSTALVSLGRFDDSETLISDIRAPEGQAEALGALARAVAAKDRARALRLLNKAADIAATCSSSTARAYRLGTVAVELANLNDPRADELFAAGEEAANDPRMPHFNRSFALSHLVVNLVKGGRFERASQVSIPHANVSQEMNENLVNALAQRGRYDEAESKALLISHLDARDRALSRLTSILIRDGQFERAEKVAVSIGGTLGRQGRAVGELIIALANSGNVDRAIATAHSIPLGNAGPDVLANLATLLSKLGDSRGREVLDMAVEATVARQLDKAISGRDAALRELSAGLVRLEDYRLAEGVARRIDSLKERASAFVTLARELKKVSSDQADKLLDEAEEGLKAPASEHFSQFLHDLSVNAGKDLVGPNLRRKADRGTKELSEELANAGEIDRARKLALSIAEPEPRAAALNLLAGVLTEAASPDINDLIADARAAARSIEYDQRRAEMLVQLAVNVSSVSNAVADASVADAIRVVDQLPDKDPKVGMICDLAGATLKWSVERAQGFCREAWTLADAIQDESRDRSLARVAGAFAKTGDFDEATRIIGEIKDGVTRSKAEGDLAFRLVEAGAPEPAQEAASLIAGDYERALAFRDVAVGLIKEKRSSAEESLRQSREIAVQIRDTELRSKALSELASSLAQFGFLADAATVVETIQTVETKNDAIRDLAGAFVREGKIREGLTLVAMRSPDSRAGLARPLDDFLRILAGWMQYLEQSQHGLSSRMLKEALNVAAWIRPDWATIEQLF